jgi:cAMP-dependent protein kinase regulator
MSANKILFQEGDIGESFFIILSGGVDVYSRVYDKYTGSEFRKKVGTLKKGDSFGDLSLLYGAPRNATIKTREDTEFMYLTKDIYDRVIKS